MIAQLLLGLLAAVGALLALVVLVPFHARAGGAVHGESAAGAAEVRWGPGLLALRLSSADGLTARLLGIPLPRLWSRRGVRRSPGRRRGGPERERGRREAPRARKRPGAGAVLRHRGALLRMAVRLARPLRLRVRIAGTVGTGDPADVALLAAIARAARDLPGVELDLEWDWVDEALELDGELSARIWVAHLLCAAAALLLRRENRAALRAMRGRRIPTAEGRRHLEWNT
jgi:hypothetical protein